jgi:PEP-CTERM/exosortase A-associated glycosyltransferase
VKVLHVLESSIPDTGGYTIRARAIVDFQKRSGLEPAVVTGPIFPSKNPSVTLEHFDGVPYYRTNHIPAPASAKSKLASYGLRAMMFSRYRRAVLDIAERERPDVIHAHSSYANAYAAFPAARRLGIPLVYEVRTLWGESAVIEDGLRHNSLKHRLVWQLELGAMRGADLVVPIARGIRSELVRRGIPSSKLEVVPNGVDSTRFIPGVRDAARALAAGVDGSFVLGFVGSIRRLEGLTTLLAALAICRGQGRNMRLVVVGEGPERKVLQAEAERLGLTGVTFTGNVPHTDVASWYSIMDVLVYPRMRAVINERVTPLKPLEAMALGKVCVGSDVGGLTELIHDGETGVVFRADDAGDLAAKLMGLMDDRSRMERLRHTALEFVRRERDWRSIVPRYLELYNRIISVKGASALRSPWSDNAEGQEC